MDRPPDACEAALNPLPPVVLVGVSGGIDSVALLQALVQSGRKPVVIHFDHGWREESGGDAIWVRDLARKMGLKFVGGKMRTPAAEPGRANEAGARAARYAFFGKVARRLGIPHLALAHHADDQVETFLMQLFRGSGASGQGMAPLTRRDGLVILRPWLGVWRKEIETYARRRKLVWKEDLTNADNRFRRNMIRRRILPYLRKHISEAIPVNLLRAAEIARAESEWLDELCALESTRKELEIRELRSFGLGRQRRTIFRWLQARGVREIGFSEVEAVRGLLERRVPAKINLCAGRFARRRAGKIFVE